MSLGVLSWNVRGLNNPARRSSIRLFMQACNAALVCLQESKLDSVAASLVCNTLGPGFGGFEALPAVGTRGGILMAWKPDVLRVMVVHRGKFSITANVLSLVDGKAWMVSSVYGPHAVDDKVRFLQEIELIGQQVQHPWIINGDFNH